MPFALGIRRPARCHGIASLNQESTLAIAKGEWMPDFGPLNGASERQSDFKVKMRLLVKRLQRSSL
jgi:hypothetical protein